MLRNLQMGLAAGAVAAFASCAHAQVHGEVQFALPAQDLSLSLREVSVRTGRSIIAPSELVKGRTAPAVSGPFTAEGAVRLLLTGSGLEVRNVGNALIVFAPGEDSSSGPRSAVAAPAAAADEMIVVTGTRIRGAPLASPVFRITQADIRNAGQSDLGDVARSIPQSFGGGQNPGIGFNVPASAGGNIGGGSSVNLRGLGSDATLTLLNGRRMPYGSSRQGIDIAAIPLAAVDRLEVVADGASAIYGSDAVAGVVNVILKRDFSGLEASALIGDSTGGGDFRQQYGAVAGSRWRSGGGFVTYEHDRATAIVAGDRDYASARPGVTLLPGSTRNAVAASGHQQLTDHLAIELDALFDDRSSATTYPLNFAGRLDVSHTTQSFRERTYDLAGGASWSVGRWHLKLDGTFGRDRTAFRGDTYSSSLLSSSAAGRYDNRSVSGELGADGPLFALPGGSASLAVGTGVRRNDFSLFRGVSALQNIDAWQESLYGFAELNLPIVSPAVAIPLVHRLNLSGAVRYERYRGIASVATPKLGVIYAPSADIDLKGSWGRSFRAPSFIEQYQIRQVALYPVTVAGGSGYPSGSAALLVFGGNPALKPERASSWSATASLHPRSMPGVRLELSYFSTRYIDRIVNPIPLISLALSNPIYRSQILLNPTAAQQAAIIAAATQFINGTGGAYDPSRVVAIVDSANVNAGRQSIRGFDALFSYRADVGKGSLGISVNAAYLESEQQLSPTQPFQKLAGTLFNPPHFRSRGSLTWQSGPLILSSTVSFTGGVTDTRTTPSLWIRGMTTADVTARYRIAGGPGWLRNVEVDFSVLNVFNAAPARIATSLFYDTPYDSTNYSPVGRFVSIGLSKKW